MSYSKRASRRDDSEPAIVDALRAVGASVTILGQGDGTPDLLVGWREATYLLEVKNPLGPLGGKRGGGASLPGQGGDGVLTEDQLAWRAAWRGAPPVIVRTPAEALAAIGAQAAGAEPDAAPAARPRIRATTATCRERTAHAVQGDAGDCACGNSIADFGAPVKLRCTGCPLEYEGRMGYADGLWAPIHWTGDEGQTRRPLCTGVGVDGVPANRDIKPGNVQMAPARRRGQP